MRYFRVNTTTTKRQKEKETTLKGIPEERTADIVGIAG